MNSSSTERARRLNPEATALTDALAVVGRIAIAPLFLLSGIAKLTNPATFLAYIGSAGLPFPAGALGAAILMELIGGALLVVGYKTRVVAAMVAAFTLLTAVVFHHDLADQTQFLFFFKNVAVTGGLLQIVAFGGGRWSIDRS
ncbi:DoxX family protein [Sphingomonas sp. H39-1-10]|uniref:DoxX family protein n=1 Tax=Sphingomonas TaxID=13687 RepID=UPI000883CFB5|nr:MULTISPECIES: DoxX family protein [Sphingomonas]MDF0489970.1 DoxX family protein [Sphingomonas pollutisoli]SDA36176.1 putative oxidoreductase [Sphingomonas sp. NFR15]